MFAVAAVFVYFCCSTAIQDVAAFLPPGPLPKSDPLLMGKSLGYYNSPADAQQALPDTLAWLESVKVFYFLQT